MLDSKILPGDLANKWSGYKSKVPLVSPANKQNIDVIVIGTKSANMTPIYNPYSAIVYSAYATDVRHSIVDGKLLMEDRKALTVDEKDIIERANAFSAKIKKALTSQGKPIL